jgi:hypothetical protein
MLLLNYRECESPNQQDNHYLWGQSKNTIWNYRLKETPDVPGKSRFTTKLMKARTGAVVPRTWLNEEYQIMPLEELVGVWSRQ